MKNDEFALRKLRPVPELSTINHQLSTPMNRNFNLPPGCLADDLDGEAMPLCENCGEEHNDWQDNGLCEDCQPVEEESERQ